MELLFVLWTTASPASYEGAFDLVGVVAYLLAIPTSWIFDTLLSAAERSGSGYIMSTLDLAIISIPLNSLFAGFLLEWLYRAVHGRAASGETINEGTSGQGLYK